MLYSRDILKWKVKKEIIKAIAELKASQFEKNKHNTIFISGIQRSGTTWLSEILCEMKGAVLLWEPFHPQNLTRQFPETFVNNIKYTPFLYKNSHEYQQLSYYIEELTRGKGTTAYNYQMTTLYKYITGEFCVIKSVFGNLLLNWIADNCKIKKPIHMVRHPCAVINSQLKWGSLKDLSINNLFYENQFIDEKKYENVIKNIDNREKLLTAYWSIMNHSLLKKDKINSKWLTVFYEDLYENPSNELKRIENELSIEIPDKVTHKINNPSITTLDRSLKNQNNNQLKKWDKDLSYKQIKDIMQILKLFNVEIYDHSIYPNN